VTAVVIDVAKRTATIHGLATSMLNDRPVRFTAYVDCASRRRSVAVQLSSGYSHRGEVVRGTLDLISS
jgi:hypothetical protein